MGYEITLYTGEILLDTIDGNWLNEIAVIELCKPGYESAIYQLTNLETDMRCFFFSTDGNTKIFKDRYDKPLYAHPINVIIAALKEDTQNDNYPRFKIAYLTLSMIQKYYPKAKIVLFGH